MCWTEHLKLIKHHSASLTRPAMYGADITPNLDKQELVPIPEFLTTVGNSSAENTYITVKVPDTHILPIMANVMVAACSSITKIKHADENYMQM